MKDYVLKAVKANSRKEFGTFREIIHGDKKKRKTSRKPKHKRKQFEEYL